MNNNELLNDFAQTQINFRQEALELVKVVDVRPNKEEINVKVQSESTSYSSEMLLTVIYFFVFAVSLIIIKSFKSYQTGKIQDATSKRSSQIPCKLCRFFSHNYYLKCAVHPDLALKAEAINCPDYYPRHNIYK
ncbi:hypothetical protein [Aliterella atlantica]|uniref:hypothetical protein n=1 Tax=Aliterella atlantica TaxID=1827278 RepID=UPI000695D834|nr:hypothetical protein [Aliterella atlantica]